MKCTLRESNRRNDLVIAILVLILAHGFGCGRAQPPPSPGPHYVLPVGAPRFVDPTSNQALSSDAFTLDFGRVQLGSDARAAVRIRNEGTGTFAVVAIEPTADFPSAAFAFRSSPFSVSPGSEAAFAVTFRPTDTGEVSGSLKLDINDGTPSALTLTLRGVGYHGTNPEIAVVPSQLDFGEVAVGSYLIRRLTIANLGEDMPGTTADNLRFAVKAEDGSWTEKRPEVTGADADQYGIEWPPELYPVDGIAGGGGTADLIVRFAPTSLGRKDAVIAIATNDPARPTVEVPVTGAPETMPPCDLAIVPPQLNFGAVEQSRSLVLPFKVTNRDPNPSHECRIESIGLAWGEREFALVDGSIENVSLRGGTTLSLPVRFSPETDGTFSGAIRVSLTKTNPPGRDPDVRPVYLYGVGHSPCVAVFPRDYDFGTRGVSCASSDQVFTIYNVCTGAAVVTSIGLSEDSSPEFSVTKKPALRATISPGAVAEVRLAYRPVDIGDDTATLEITLDDDADPIVIPLRGRGAEVPIQTDTFSQAPMPKVDILFVVDNSSSMADKQTALATNFASFIQYAVQQQLDYHIAMTTTDVTATGEAGRLLPLTGTNPRVVTPTTPNKEQVFSQNAAVGTSGSETESLLRPAYLALSGPLVTGHNAGFYRDEATLAVVIVSDSVDTDPLLLPVVFYESFFSNMKWVSRARMVTFSAIIPTLPYAPAGCSYDDAVTSQNTRVRDLVQRTGGLLGEICDPDWATTIERIGTQAFGWRTTFFLSHSPDLSVGPNAIVVIVDGQTVPETDAQGVKHWAYNPSSNAIEFDPIYVPGPGTTLTVSYLLACIYG